MSEKTTAERHAAHKQMLVDHQTAKAERQERHRRRKEIRNRTPITLV